MVRKVIFGRLILKLLPFVGRLRFPNLFLLTGALFGVSLVAPDAIPMVDEILLGLGTLLLGRYKDDRLAAKAARDAAEDNQHLG
jgi:hypothetical protein